MLNPAFSPKAMREITSVFYPIAHKLRDILAQKTRGGDEEIDMSVWLSTTMIQALRDLIDLYTYYFETLERFLDGLLDLLCVCICQGLSAYAIPTRNEFSIVIC